MPKIDHEFIVLGTGGIGSAALYQLAKRGADVLGIDQYPAGHDKGSSHGDSRLIRLVYFEHPDYVPLLRSAFDLWRDLETESERELLIMTGLLQAGPADGDVITGLVKAAQYHDLKMEQLSADLASKRFPGIKLKSTQTAIFDENAGVLKVEDCVRTHIELAQKNGAQLKSGAVTGWHEEDEVIKVHLGDETLYCRNLIITPGAWAADLLPALSPFLKIRRKALFWFDDHEPKHHIQNNFPVFFVEDNGHNYYGFPAMDAKGIKVADHQGGDILASPTELDDSLDTKALSEVNEALRQYLPAVGDHLAHYTNCMYTMSCDEHFIVGLYPGSNHVNFVAGLSGHGFKFAPVLGEVMADLAMTGKTAHPISFLSPDRFQT